MPPLPTLQVISGNSIGHCGGIKRPFQPQLLGCQEAGLGIQVLNLLLELGLPEVYVLQALAQSGCGVLLGTLGSGSGMSRQLLGLGPVALALLAAAEGLVVQIRVALVPLVRQVLGSTETGRGQAAGRVRPRVQHGHRLRHVRCSPPGVIPADRLLEESGA
uniref:Tektin n=1 Tax=Strigops habroptila TaxID=2489341 RepID=A0A672UZQ4_STRHB